MRFDAPASNGDGDAGAFEDPFSRRFLSFSGLNAGMGTWDFERGRRTIVERYQIGEIIRC